MSKNSHLVVVGGGLAGLMAVIKAVEENMSVSLLSLVPVKRSHSVCAQGGINAAIDPKNMGDSPWVHFYDTVYGGDFLANQPPVLEMTEAAPHIIHLFDRMGVPFNRTPEGDLDFRAFGGAKYPRTAFAGATTGQQLIYALDEQVRRLEYEGKVQKFESMDFLNIVQDEQGRCIGCIAQDTNTMKLHRFKGDAVVIASGGLGMVYGKSTNSIINYGTPLARCYMKGALYANPEMVQIHPTAISGDDKLRLISESVRGEGGRVWTYKDGKPWYFLEERYPAYGNLVPRDIATREIYSVCVDEGLGVDGERQVYLDVTHIDPDYLTRKLGGVMEIYEKFKGVDPRKVPMKIFPGMHYSMGGFWVDYNKMTNIPGLFAIGECEYEYHGANRLGANSLLSTVFSGMKVAKKIPDFLKEHGPACDDEAYFEAEEKLEQEKLDKIARMSGTENPYAIHDELGNIMSLYCGVVRSNEGLDKALALVRQLMERYQHIGLCDESPYCNQDLHFIRRLWDMLILGETILAAARLRDESRGAHYKPEFPERNDEVWLKTTLAHYQAAGPSFSFAEVDTSLVEPVLRNYKIEH